jgi:glycosyltransferase involved in cell wall biosynthesis
MSLNQPANGPGPAGFAIQSERMSDSIPRVAYFPDSFHEVNGVAHTSRHFEAFARRRGWPFLCVRAGNCKQALVQDGAVWTLELPRGAFSISVEKDLSFDPIFPRHALAIRRVMECFKPDLVHITGPSEVGLVGAWMAHAMQLPLAAGWHTNIHEYMVRRSGWWLRRLPLRKSEAASRALESLTLRAIAWLYSKAQVTFAPNHELCAMVERASGRPCHLMPRGVDAELFQPRRRSRAQGDKELVLGYVGRMSVEKNVALLAQIQKQLENTLGTNFRFMMVGHGKQEQWLRERLPRAEFTGVLRGEQLAQAYANMDAFVFPSHTDTFGNVVLEALASGVPAVVTPSGGPASIVKDGVTGRIVADENFAAAIAEVVHDPLQHEAMRQAARNYALKASWDAVFDGVYSAYVAVGSDAVSKQELGARNASEVSEVSETGF